MVVDERYVLRVPKGLDPARAAPLMCAGITTYSPLRQFGCKRGDQVAVVGLGGLGHMVVKLAKSMGADVSVLSGSRDKEKDAARLGAKRFVATREPGALEALEGTCDLILDTVSAPHDLNKQLTLLRNFGTMVAIVERGTWGVVHRAGVHGAPVPGERSGEGTGGERHVRVRRPLGLAYPSAGPDAHCDGRPRLRATLGRSRRRDSSRGCGLVFAGREALARRHATQRDDAHRHPGGTRRQGRQLDGESRRRTLPANSVSEGGRSIMTALDGWENFYVIVGSSAGALIGLQFVVSTIIAARPITRSTAQAGGAFATPSGMPFAVPVLHYAKVSAPRRATT